MQLNFFQEQPTTKEEGREGQGEIYLTGEMSSPLKSRQREEAS